MKPGEVNTLASLEKDIRRKDEQVRNLGIEINDLTKQRDKLKEEVEQWNNNLTQIQSAHKVLDDVINSKNEAFETTKASALEDINAKKEELQKTKEELETHKAVLSKKEVELNNKAVNIETVKQEAITHVKSMVNGIHEEIDEFIKLFEQA